MPFLIFFSLSVPESKHRGCKQLSVAGKSSILPWGHTGEGGQLVAPGPRGYRELHSVDCGLVTLCCLHHSTFCLCCVLGWPNSHLLSTKKTERWTELCLQGVHGDSTRHCEDSGAGQPASLPVVRATGRCWEDMTPGITGCEHSASSQSLTGLCDLGQGFDLFTLFSISKIGRLAISQKVTLKFKCRNSDKHSPRPATG